MMGVHLDRTSGGGSAACFKEEERLMRWMWLAMVGGLLCGCAGAQATPTAADLMATDLRAVTKGPISVEVLGSGLTVAWRDGASHAWVATFSLEASKALVTSITADGKVIVERANPVFRLSAGKRRGGWDNFFDFPPAGAEGTRSFVQDFHPTAVRVATVGNRVEVDFNGMKLGMFSGVVRYTFYPGTALVQQAAVMATEEPDTAYLYDEGLEMAAKQDERAGGTMDSAISFYEPAGGLMRLTAPYGSERHALEVRYRAVAVRAGSGSVAVFPAPHRYLFPRDYTTNLGFNWYSSWRGKVGVGIRLPPDDNTLIYSWINAPAGSRQEMGMFLMLGEGAAEQTLGEVLKLTHHDRFEHVPGFVTFAPHWHFAFTEQVKADGEGWVPAFKPTLMEMGVDAVMPMDFHGDGHPYDLTPLRLEELREYYAASRKLSDGRFLLIPAEEGNTIVGGHWGLAFPHDVYFYFDRKPGEELKTNDASGRAVYRVHSADDVLAMVKAEDGLMYTTHPRTKGSTGYPDKYLREPFFRDAAFVGVGWKAMPPDLSLAGLGARAFKTLDDVNNLGFHKVLLGEVDVFQVAATDELYSQMNVNYLPLGGVPGYDDRGKVLKAAAEGKGFISTGEVLLPRVGFKSEKDAVEFDAEVRWTFPLREAEIVWGDGRVTHREVMKLDTTGTLAGQPFHWRTKAPGWRWARVAVWDVAGDGAFTNPQWNERVPEGSR